MKQLIDRKGLLLIGGSGALRPEPGDLVWLETTDGQSRRARITSKVDSDAICRECTPEGLHIKQASRWRVTAQQIQYLEKAGS